MRPEDDPILRKYPDYLRTITEGQRDPKRPTEFRTLLAKLRERLAENGNLPTASEAEKKLECPDCNDTGSHPVGDGSGRWTVCYCMDAKRRKANLTRLWAEANFPDDIGEQEIDGMDLSHPDTLGLVEAAKDYLREPQPPILALFGSNGNGKTRVALATAKALLMNEEMPVYFAYLPHFLKQLQKGQFTGRDYPGQDHAELFERVCGKGLVVLDDLGLYKATPWADVQFDTIMGYRYLMGYPTIITANVGLADLPVRMQSRLSDPAKCRIVVVLAPDHREKNKPKTRKD